MNPRNLFFVLTLGIALSLPSFALAGIQAGKVVMVVGNDLAMIDMQKSETFRFDIGDTMVLRDGLLVKPSSLQSGDWVTVTTEMQENKEVVTLVEASSNR